MSKWEYAAYFLCLLWAGNHEQVMVILLGAYLTATIYFLCRKRLTPYIVLLLAVSIGSCLFTLTCPGLKVRKALEVKNWFPTWGMLDIFDKVDLAVGTTFRWILFDNNLFVILSCLILAICIFEKYEDRMIRFIACIPVMLTILLGPFLNIVSYFYPLLGLLSGNVPYYGLVNAETQGESYLIVQYLTLIVPIMCIIVELFLLQDTLEAFLVTFVLIGSGVASRLAMGYSPTIYASGYRTCTVMSYCIISAVIFTMNNHIRNVERKENKRSVLVSEKLVLFYMGIIFLSLLSTWSSVSLVRPTL